MKKACPICGQTVIGDLNEHVDYCAERDAMDSAPDEFIEFFDDDFDIVRKAKQFDEFYSDCSLDERSVLKVCPQCLNYGIALFDPTNNCPSCGGELTLADDYYARMEAEDDL